MTPIRRGAGILGGAAGGPEGAPGGRVPGGPAGLFAKLDETGADGFMPARTIGDDYFRFHEDKRALIGDRTGETHRLGDRVKVRLVEAAPVAGALRFELLSDGRVEAGGRHVRRERGEDRARTDRPARQYRGKRRR